MHFYEYVCKNKDCKNHEEPIYQTSVPKDIQLEECPLCGDGLEELRVLHKEGEWYRGAYNN